MLVKPALDNAVLEPYHFHSLPAETYSQAILSSLLFIKGKYRKLSVEVCLAFHHDPGYYLLLCSLQKVSEDTFLQAV